MNAAVRGPVPLVVGLSLIVATTVGLFAGYDARYVVVGLIAAVSGATLLVRPILGLMLLAALVPVENIVVLGGITGSKIIGLTVFAAWLLRKIALRESWKTIVTCPVFIPGFAFIGLIVLSILWAANHNAARTGFVQIAQMVMLALIIVDLARPWSNLESLVKALMLGALTAATLTVLQSTAPGFRRAGDDIAGGINATAVLLVTLIPLGFYLIRSRQRSFWRIVGIAYVGLASLAVLLTLSRFNLLLLPPLLLALSFLMWRDGQNRKLFLFAAAIAVVGMFVYVPWDKLIERGTSIAPYIAQTIDPSDQGGVSSRGYHLKIGLEIAKDHPILGVGYGNYGQYFRDEYQFEVFGRERLYRSHRSAHSSYVGILADLGMVGLALWLFILGGCALALSRAWRITAQRPLSHPHLLVQSLSAAIALHILGYGLYIPNQKEKILWIVIGMSFAAVAMIQAWSERTGGGED